MSERPWRIGIIDDNEDDRVDVRRLLLKGSERRYVFVEADTGARGIELCHASEAPDCVVLDYNLPDMSAEDVLAELTGPDGGPKLPVVVMTGSGGGRENPYAVLRAGAQDYLGKGWMGPENLTRVIENAIERWRMARDLRERTQRLHESEERLQVADRAKDEFLATLAHELRNPLAPIRNGVAVLRSKAADAAMTDRTLGIMERQLHHMVHLVDDLLDVSRIGRGKIVLQRENVVLANVVADAIDSSRPIIEAARHTLVVEGEAASMHVFADPTRLAQVVTNVLNNAAKFTPSGGTITVRCRAQDGQAVIAIADTGVGIARDKLPEVFALFAQVDATINRSQGGLGIGLSIARRLVEMHGGTMTASSEGEGRGSEFVVRLPLADQVVTIAPEAPKVVGLAGRRILIVDDNVDAAETLALLLESRKSVTAVAFDGDSALGAVRTFAPDVVLLDLGLPTIDGYEVIGRLRADPATKGLKVIALTGWGSDAEKQRTTEALFDGHLTKPISIEALERCLDGHC